MFFRELLAVRPVLLNCFLCLIGFFAGHFLHGEEPKVSIWPISTITAHEKRPVQHLAYSKEGDRIATVGAGNLKVFNVKTKECLREFGFDRASPGDIEFLPDGNHIQIFLGHPQAPGWTLHQCDIATGDVTKIMSWDEKYFPIGFSISKTKIILAANDGGEWGGSITFKTIHLPKNHTVTYRAVAPVHIRAISQDLQLLVVAEGFDNLVVVETETMKVTQRLPIVGSGSIALFITPDKKTLLNVPLNRSPGNLNSGQVDFWDLETGKKKSSRTMTHIRHLGTTTPDGQYVVGWNGFDLRFFIHLQDPDQDFTVKAGSHPIRCLRFAPDGKTYAIGDEKGNVRIFDTPKMKEPGK